MDAVINDTPDYVFNMTANNKETIIKLVYEVMCLGLEDYKLDLWFEVYDENEVPDGVEISFAVASISSADRAVSSVA